MDCYEVTEFSTGVGRVINAILRCLIDIFPDDKFFIFTREKVEEYSGANINQVVISSPEGYFRWQNGPFVRSLKETKPDILIASNYTLPLFNRWKSILFEYDVSFVVHPEWFSRREAFVRKALVRRSLRKASAVVTISEFSRNEIVKNFKVNPEKIKVISLGVEDKFERSSDDETNAWKEVKGLKDKKIIGYLGSIFNRRNIPLLVDGVNLLREKIPEAVLYIIGDDRTHPSQNIEQLLDRDWIRWETSMREEELPIFYSAIDTFAYLSEYEGFGLPPLEALACGAVPVVLDRSSLREVYQGLAVMVDDPKTIPVREALERAMTDDKEKQNILERFEERRSQHEWPKIAEEFSLMIKNLVSR